MLSFQPDRDGSEAFEEREERVGRAVSAGLGAERRSPGDCFLFEGRVGVLVDVGGFGALVPEPHCDRCDVDAFGSEQHRVGVPVTWNST
jgi:hypothetical protein